MRLDRSKFRAWLKTKQPDEIVGEQRTCHGCPITNFYLETTGGQEIITFERWGDYYIDRGYDKRRMPTWAENFVVAVDDEKNPKITAARALEILTA